MTLSNQAKVTVVLLVFLYQNLMGTIGMCTVSGKVNSVIKTDIFPIPRIDDFIDNTGHAKYVTRFDLLKGF